MVISDPRFCATSCDNCSVLVIEIPLTSRIISPEVIPAISAGDPALTPYTSTDLRSGMPTCMKIVAKRTTPRIRLNNGPPINVINRAIIDESLKPPFNSGSFSPLNRTKAPKGIQFKVISVSLNLPIFNNLGGKPNPNSSTFILNNLANIKCPNSWTKSKTPKININSIIIIDSPVFTNKNNGCYRQL